MAKIAILSFYSGKVERGVETFVLEVAKRLSKKHEIAIFQSGQTNYGLRSKVRLITVNSHAKSPRSSKGILGKLYLDLQALRILIFSIQSMPKIFKLRPNVIIPSNGGWQTPIFRLISKIIGAKLIIIGHAGIGSDDAWNLMFRPDTFVALTSTQKIWAKNLAHEVKVVKIANGVDLSHFNPKSKVKNVPLQRPIVVCAAALVPYKRVDLTVRAVATAGNMSLLILGDGELRGAIDSLAKRLLGKNYLRVVATYKDMPAYLRACQVFTLVSKTEAFGISYIEAMACNLPVVATNDHSRAEIVGRAGILTMPENINQYAKDLSIAAKTKYRNIPYNQSLQFSWNNIAQKYLTLISELTKTKAK